MDKSFGQVWDRFAHGRSRTAHRVRSGLSTNGLRGRVGDRGCHSPRADSAQEVGDAGSSQGPAVTRLRSSSASAVARASLPRASRGSAIPFTFPGSPTRLLRPRRGGRLQAREVRRFRTVAISDFLLPALAGPTPPATGGTGST